MTYAGKWGYERQIQKRILPPTIEYYFGDRTAYSPQRDCERHSASRRLVGFGRSRFHRVLLTNGVEVRAVGGDLIEPITCRLIQGKLPILFSLAVSYQQRPIVFPLPLEFYLQKISISRLYSVIRFHSLALSPAWYRPAEQHRLPCPLL